MAELICSRTMPGGQRLRLYKGDLTEEDVDAIVNAANSWLQHGGGVAGAIVRKGGRVIQDESNQVGRVTVGNVAMTGAGSLRARFVIHAVGPRMGEGDEDEKLSNAVRNTLVLADEKRLTSIALPAISAGIFGFPKDRCAQILIGEAVSFYEAHANSTLRDVRFTLIDAETLGCFRLEFERRWGAFKENE